MKASNILLIVVISLVLTIGLSSCSKENTEIQEESPFKVTYFVEGNEYTENWFESWIVPGEQFEVLSYEGRIKEGYSFEKWNTEADGSGTDYPVKSMFTMIPSDVNFYQVLEPHTDTSYTVEYFEQDLGRDTFSLAQTKTMSGTTDTIVNVADIDYEGFSLIQDYPDQVSEGTICGDGSLTLKLYFSRKSCPVTFKYGSATFEDETVDFQYGEYISKKKIPKSDGYLFLGCYTDESFSKRWVLSEDTVTGPMTLFVKLVEATDVSDFELDQKIYLGNSTTIKQYTGKSTDVVIPKFSLYTKIDDYAFSQCEHIKSVILPDSVTSIGEGAFSDCENLSEIVIPEGVTYIGADAFKDCTSLVSIEIPDSVVFLGSGAFSGCENLSVVRLSENMDNIGNNTFSGCSHLNDIVVPESITAIGEKAFSGCIGLENLSIPDSVGRFSHHVFEGCENLNVIYLGKNYDTLAKLNYELSDNLTNSVSSFEYSIVEDQVTIDKFTGHESFVVIPEIIEGYPVTTVGPEAFESSFLIRITIPDTITSIKESAFSQCNHLKKIDMSDSIESIGEWAFFDCGVLTDFNIPDTVTSIKNHAFSSCNSLTDIILPKGIDMIDNSVFNGCSSLKSITLTENITSIGDYAFYGCDDLKNIYIPHNVTSMGKEVFGKCRNLTDIYCEAEKKPLSWDGTWDKNCDAKVYWSADFSENNSFETTDLFLLEENTIKKLLAELFDRKTSQNDIRIDHFIVHQTNFTDTESGLILQHYTLNKLDEEEKVTESTPFSLLYADNNLVRTVQEQKEKTFEYYRSKVDTFLSEKEEFLENLNLRMSEQYAYASSYGEEFFTQKILSMLTDMTFEDSNFTKLVDLMKKSYAMYLYEKQLKELEKAYGLLLEYRGQVQKADEQTLEELYMLSNGGLNDLHMTKILRSEFATGQFNDEALATFANILSDGNTDTVSLEDYLRQFEEHELREQSGKSEDTEALFLYYAMLATVKEVQTHRDDQLPATDEELISMIQNFTAGEAHLYDIFDQIDNSGNLLVDTHLRANRRSFDITDRLYEVLNDSYPMFRPYNIGDIGPEGGFIFFVDELDEYNNWDYLEAAPYGWYDYDNDPYLEWDGNMDFVYETYTFIGSGEFNTDVVMPIKRYSPSAVQVCYDHCVTVNGEIIDDWFLPSRDELNQMYNNLYLFGIGGLSSNSYWSSSAVRGFQVIGKTAVMNDIWRQWFVEKEENVEPMESKMWDPLCVRPARIF